MLWGLPTPIGRIGLPLRCDHVHGRAVWCGGLCCKTMHGSQIRPRWPCMAFPPEGASTLFSGLWAAKPMRCCGAQRKKGSDRVVFYLAGWSPKRLQSQACRRRVGRSCCRNHTALMAARETTLKKSSFQYRMKVSIKNVFLQSKPLSGHRKARPGIEIFER